jgi:hypothetical protein
MDLIYEGDSGDAVGRCALANERSTATLSCLSGQVEDREARSQFLNDCQKRCWVDGLHTQHTPQSKAFVDPRSDNDPDVLYESISTDDPARHDPLRPGGVNGYCHSALARYRAPSPRNGPPVLPAQRKELP